MKRLIFGLCLVVTMAVASEVSAQKIIAHRGHHSVKGAEENSLAALKAAYEAGIYAVECDVNMTSDGELVVVHGPWLGKKDDSDRLNVQRTDLATLRSKLLSNGEPVPTLDEFLELAATNTDTKLIIEVKDHATPQLETEVVRKVVAAVKQHKLQDIVTYIAFRQHVCNEFVRLAPANTPVMYLGSNLTPEYVKGLGYTGINYSVEALRRLPRWIDEAHKLGLEVSIWTVNSCEDAAWAVKHGVDYITTDKPSVVERALE